MHMKNYTSNKLPKNQITIKDHISILIFMFKGVHKKLLNYILKNETQLEYLYYTKCYCRGQ